MTTPRDKPALRLAIRGRLAALSATHRARAAELACEYAASWDPLATASTVMLYAPLADELDVRPLTDQLLAQNVRICLPRVNWDRSHIEPALITDPDRDLEPGERGVARPRRHAPAVPLDELQVVVVPGLGFDRVGGRLGRGGGFYDRFLARLPAGVAKLGICFDEQIIPLVPMETHDARVDALATPTRLSSCRGEEPQQDRAPPPDPSRAPARTEDPS